MREQKMEPTEKIEAGGDDAEPPESLHQVSLANQQTNLKLDEAQLTRAVRSVLSESSFKTATVSLAIVDDPEIHRLNRQFLEHDYPTDVLSFVLEDDGSHLEGQLVVSADTARDNAAQYGWSPAEELLLYVVHGALHLVGYRDKEPAELAAMRSAEEHHLSKLGVTLPQDHHALAEERT